MSAENLGVPHPNYDDIRFVPLDLDGILAGATTEPAQPETADAVTPKATEPDPHAEPEIASPPQHRGITFVPLDQF